MNTMHTKSHRRYLTTAVALLQLMMSFLWVLPATTSYAQVSDGEPPVIDFEAVSQGFIGDSQVFTATVSDDTKVEVVTLYYRFSEDALYANREMSMLGNTGIYTTTIDTDAAPVGTTSIQYYMEALDSAGNRTLQGFAFDPIERELLDTPVATAQPSAAPVASTGMSTGRKIVYGVLGLVVVGALAASSSGGSSSSQPSVPVTINVQELP